MKKIKCNQTVIYLNLFVALIGFIIISYLIMEPRIFKTLLISIVSIMMYVIFYWKNRDVFNPDGVFSLIWIFSIGLCQLQLSQKQYDWEPKVWFVILSSWFTYILGSFIVDLGINKKRVFVSTTSCRLNSDKLKKSILLLFLISLSSFILEVAVAGYVPLFSSSMGGYVGFGLPFIHYNTVAMVVVVLLSFYYLLCYDKDKIVKLVLVIGILQIISIVSRQLILFAFIGAIIIYHYKRRKIKPFILGVCAICALFVFGIMGLLRNQSLKYLYYVADIKPDVNKSFLMWGYLYITMSFENLRNLVMSNVEYTYGKISFEPIWALTRVKTMFASVDGSQYYTIKEFNVSTFLRDYYLDFGIIGTLVFPFIIGFFSKYIYRKLYYHEIYVFIYIFVVHNLVFTFFVNFYGNTSIMINLVYFIIVCFYSKNNTINNKIPTGGSK